MSFEPGPENRPSEDERQRPTPFERLQQIASILDVPIETFFKPRDAAASLSAEEQAEAETSK